jgi:hypothetical protein
LCTDKKERDPTFRKQPQDVAASAWGSAAWHAEFFSQQYCSSSSSMEHATAAWTSHQQQLLTQPAATAAAAVTICMKTS